MLGCANYLSSLCINSATKGTHSRWSSKVFFNAQFVYIQGLEYVQRHPNYNVWEKPRYIFQRIVLRLLIAFIVSFSFRDQGKSFKAKDRIAQKLLCFTHDLDTKHQR